MPADRPKFTHDYVGRAGEGRSKDEGPQDNRVRRACDYVARVPVHILCVKWGCILGENTFAILRAKPCVFSNFHFAQKVRQSLIAKFVAPRVSILTRNAQHINRRNAISYAFAYVPAKFQFALKLREAQLSHPFFIQSLHSLYSNF